MINLQTTNNGNKMEESCADIKEKLKVMDKFKKITKLASDYDKGRQTNIIQRTVSQIL
jgi:hypothetical protein